jgi:small subunit ribosomal protein S16
MKRMGRKNRPYYRIVAIDGRQPRDGRVLEDLGTYDPEIRETDKRVMLRPERIKHWISVGAKPSENVQVLINKYLKKFEEGAAAPAPQTTTT